MGKYSNYNLIPIGDHCAISIILKSLNLRTHSFPFDWVSSSNPMENTNIIYNTNLLNQLNDIDTLVKNYICNAFENNNINSATDIIFPHEHENPINTFEKYKRRFIRLKDCLSGNNIFILLTRVYYIEECIFKEIQKELLKYNTNSIILFISGIDHSYFKNISDPNIIFKFIEFDRSKGYDYDYSHFRPNITKFFSEFFS
jgi:hypothetical protein